MDPGLARDVTIIGSVALYILLTSILAIVLRSRTNAQFMVGSRALPAVVIAVLLMSEFIGAKSTVGTAQEAFEKGVAAGWSVLAASVGFLLLGLFFARQIYNSNQHTISGLIEQRFGNGTRIVVSIIMIYALLLVNVGNYLSGAAVISSALHLNLTVSAFVIAAFSAVYYVFGGLKSIAYVTVLHSLIKLAGIAILVAVAAHLTGGLQPMTQALPAHYFTIDGAVGGPTIFAWIVGTVGAIFSTQYIVQAIASNRDAAAARTSVLLSALFCLPLGFALAFIGVAARYLFPQMDSLFALPVFISKMGAPLAAVVTVSLVASVLVSVSTVALATTALVMRDFYAPWRKPGPEQELTATRYVALAVGLAPLLFVFFAPHILQLSFFTRALRLSIAIVALIGVFLPLVGSPRSAVTALIASGVATTAWYLLGNPFGVDNIYVAAIVPFVILGADRVLRGRSQAQSVEQQEVGR
ncbi:sodium:solute symporter family protein [Phenylobacterium aquaticum]|uniref:sodium:solute symporter family protein n=1 Tax=Phenylobacterium aquaticum TaxID=1763816 RepID=UPI001F5D4336|nr:sodium:solute symporter family protein [Phenylobacterium aquaticum]MCI3131083.1 sodium:solute symporter family protein [Phenylobacterium aquaticum]